jgi:hypothetical protein
MKGSAMTNRSTFSPSIIAAHLRRKCSAGMEI